MKVVLVALLLVALVVAPAACGYRGPEHYYGSRCGYGYYPRCGGSGYGYGRDYGDGHGYVHGYNYGYRGGNYKRYGDPGHYYGKYNGYYKGYGDDNDHKYY